MSQQEGIDCLLSFQRRVDSIYSQFGPGVYTFVCNKSDYEALVGVFKSLKPAYATNTVAKIKHVYGVKIEMKVGVQFRGYFLDENGERVDET